MAKPIKRNCPITCPLAMKMSAVTPISEATIERPPCAGDAIVQPTITVMDTSHSPSSKRFNVEKGLLIFIVFPQKSIRSRVF
jgi:hypothetical protein